MNRYEYNDQIIEVFNEEADSPNNYSLIYFSGDENDYQVSHHGIRVFENGIAKASCLLIGFGGATGISENSSLIQENTLLVCCCDTIFCINLPALQLNWKLKADLATCFQVLPLEKDFIVHGEVEISRIDINGNVKWSFSGHDIFVCLDGTSAFELLSDHILLHDFLGNSYMLDFHGKLMA